MIPRSTIVGFIGRYYASLDVNILQSLVVTACRLPLDNALLDSTVSAYEIVSNIIKLLS